MEHRPIRVELTDSVENFEKLVTLVNFYNKTLDQYQKVLRILESAPKENGAILLDERCFDVIRETLADYDSVTAYTQKMMSKDQTLH
jgi:hypothetical protein